MLREDIERLYCVFSRYQHPAQLEGCPCCTSPAEGRTLISKSLRDITAPELERYAYKALSTWGNVEDYKYFLPRILELTEDGSLICATEVTFQKLHYGDFQDWPQDEQQAVRDHIFASWSLAVHSLDTHRADSILCGAAPALGELTSLLDHADTIAPNFKAAYAGDCSNRTRGKLTNAFWQCDTPSYQQVLSWLYSSGTNGV